jgi:hypothetical protein
MRRQRGGWCEAEQRCVWEYIDLGPAAPVRERSNTPQTHAEPEQLDERPLDALAVAHA